MGQEAAQGEALKCGLGSQQNEMRVTMASVSRLTRLEFTATESVVFSRSLFFCSREVLGLGVDFWVKVRVKLVLGLGFRFVGQV